MRDRAVDFAAQREVIAKVRKLAADAREPCPTDYEIMTFPGGLVQLSTQSLRGAVESWFYIRSPQARLPGRPPIDRSSWVYFVRALDMIKIGTSTNVAKRLQALRTASPVPLETLLVIPGSPHLEYELHKRYAALRSHGEWFRAEQPLVGHIARLTARAAKRAA